MKVSKSEIPTRGRQVPNNSMPNSSLYHFIFRAQKCLEQLLIMIAEFPVDKPTDPNLQEKIKKIRAKFKQVQYTRVICEQALMADSSLCLKRSRHCLTSNLNMRKKQNQSYHIELQSTRDLVVSVRSFGRRRYKEVFIGKAAKRKELRNNG